MFSRAFSLDVTALPRHQGDARSFLFSASPLGTPTFWAAAVAVSATHTSAFAWAAAA